MYTPRTSVEAIPNASIHHSALQNRDFGHTYDRSRALVRALGGREKETQRKEPKRDPRKPILVELRAS